jgi:hypothetical protein
VNSARWNQEGRRRAERGSGLEETRKRRREFGMRKKKEERAEIGRKE